MHGIGNDFVFIDAIRNPLPEERISAYASRMSDRKFGVGGDGLILAERGETAPFRMRMFNPDGTYSDMCGNGVRCMAQFLVDKGHTMPGRFEIQVSDRNVLVENLSETKVRVNMGKALLTRGEIGLSGEPSTRFVNEEVRIDGEIYRGTAVSMGNPHLVLIVDDAWGFPLESVGPKLEHHELFPERTNVHLVQVVDRQHLIQRTWERGAGITLACGSGACACAVAAFLNGVADPEVDIQLPGGHLQLQYADDGTVMMTGPVETVFEGQWPD